QEYRFTAKDQIKGDLVSVLEAIAAHQGPQLTADNFRFGEETRLATSLYVRYDQILAGNPIKGKSVRLWLNPQSRELILADDFVEPQNIIALYAAPFDGPSHTPRDSTFFHESAKSLVAGHEDRHATGYRIFFEWINRQLRAVVEANAKRGQHRIEFDAYSGKLIIHRYRFYPTEDFLSREITLEALLYPIYEEYDGKLLPRKILPLKYINRSKTSVGDDPFAPLKTRKYYEKMYDDEKGQTEEGRAQGYWSDRWLSKEASVIKAGLPETANRFRDGLVLNGRYVSVSLHPDALDKNPDVDIKKRYSGEFVLTNHFDKVQNDMEYIPSSAYWTKGIFSLLDTFKFKNIRDPNHDIKTYIKLGYDEMQVYYATTELFDKLHGLGFTDPNFSEKPFKAIIHNPDVEMRDNAYYTNDTINFTNYSPKSLNYARDNTTIWHEMAHGFMDRLLGTKLEYGGTGGLSEGMSDFIAEIGMRAHGYESNYPGYDKRRILNSIQFNLTNEIHDDGEAFGGVLKDILDSVMVKDRKRGLVKVGDLIFEAMRFVRDHPDLDAGNWFKALLFADELGKASVREPTELAPHIVAAFQKRNFPLTGTGVSFDLVYNGQSVDPEKAGSRSSPIRVEMAEMEEKDFQVVTAVRDGSSISLELPIRMEIHFQTGALQGAIHFVGEEEGIKKYEFTPDMKSMTIPLRVRGKCDFVNREDGSCVDYAYFLLFKDKDTQPFAKKRFYIRIKNSGVNRA
ncbi:MAG: hypothetical protein HQK54_16930, partial [Oligoflexales bacterium]|nr:hypothetical protein [Oligoflexales bacterium]